MSDQKHPHDYRSRRDKPGAALVVRPGNKYGGAFAGEEILVDECELRNPSTMAACAPREVLDKAAAEREAARVRLEAERKKGSMQTAIDAGLAQLQQADRIVETAISRADVEAETAGELAKERALVEAARELPDVFERADSAMLPGGLKRAGKPSKGKGK